MFYCIQLKNSIALFHWTTNLSHITHTFFSKNFPNTLLVLVPVFTSGQGKALRHKGVLLKNKSKLPIKFVLLVYAKILSIKSISPTPCTCLLTVADSEGRVQMGAKPSPHPSDLEVNFNTCSLTKFLQWKHSMSLLIMKYLTLTFIS